MGMFLCVWGWLGHRKDLRLVFHIKPKTMARLIERYPEPRFWMKSLVAKFSQVVTQQEWQPSSGIGADYKGDGVGGRKNAWWQSWSPPGYRKKHQTEVTPRDREQLTWTWTRVSACTIGGQWTEAALGDTNWDIYFRQKHTGRDAYPLGLVSEKRKWPRNSSTDWSWVRNRSGKSGFFQEAYRKGPYNLGK